MKYVIYIPAIIAFTLQSCSEAEAPKPKPIQEPWSHEAETLFQNAEALKYAVEEAREEDRRLEQLGVNGQTPTLPY